MALTKDDLQAISELMDAKLDPINSRLDSLEAGQAAIKEEMRKGFETVHGDIGDLYENHDKHMAIISEGLGHLNERYAQLDQVEQTVDNHDARIFALEQKAANE